MQTPFARYFCFRKIDMFFALLKTRYDINLVAERQHIECKAHIESFMTYRKSCKEFISMKKDIFLSKNVFFLGAGAGFEPTALLRCPENKLRAFAFPRFFSTAAPSSPRSSCHRQRSVQMPPGWAEAHNPTQWVSRIQLSYRHNKKAPERVLFLLWKSRMV